jgi:hypothetical protein
MNIAELQTLIRAQRLNWTAAETPFSALSDPEKRRRLGAVPPSGGPSLAERERLTATRGLPAVGPALPASVDWRNKGGANWITAIEDQGGCGSCVAFGCVGSFESHVRIARSDGGLAVDLSEADLWFCWGPNHSAGQCPSGGWWPDNALPGLVQGIVDAACFGYTASNQACNRCANAQSRLTKATGWHSISSVSDIKSFLATSGPLITCFTVRDDFYNYTGNIYSPSNSPTNVVVGGHCVCVVGYDDNNSCWMCKNSWGATFGEQGFFRIAYGVCGIDAEMWAIEGVEAAPIDQQLDWRWCNKCSGLFWAGGNATAGKCPAGGAHVRGTTDYSVVMNAPGAPGQHDWRWCDKCSGLFWAGGNATAGKCPAGGAHVRGTTDYAVVMDAGGAPGQHDWRWCDKCSGLFWAGGNATAGTCPAGDAHVRGSSDYTVLNVV